MRLSLRLAIAIALAAAHLSAVAAVEQGLAALPPSPGQLPAAGAGGAPTFPPAAVERAAQVLAEARMAMGGARLAAVKTVVATGRTRRVRGNNLVPIEFEMAIELPDKYVRKDEVPAEESAPTSTGFAGNEVIQLPAPQGRGAAPPAAVAEAQRSARLATAKQEFARLALGLFADSLATYPLTFAYAAQAEAPQGTAHVLDVRGEGGFAARLFIATDTHLPLMLSWQAPPTGVVLTEPGRAPPQTVAPGAVIVQAPAPPAADAPADAKEACAKEVASLRQKAQTTPVEYRLYYADYRDVDGVKLPFRLRRAIGPETTEETTFDRFRLNTMVDPRRFAVK